MYFISALCLLGVLIVTYFAYKNEQSNMSESQHPVGSRHTNVVKSGVDNHVDKIIKNTGSIKASRDQDPVIDSHTKQIIDIMSKRHDMFDFFKSLQLQPEIAILRKRIKAFYDVRMDDWEIEGLLFLNRQENLFDQSKEDKIREIFRAAKSEIQTYYEAYQAELSTTKMQLMQENRILKRNEYIILNDEGNIITSRDPMFREIAEAIQTTERFTMETKAMKLEILKNWKEMRRMSKRDNSNYYSGDTANGNDKQQYQRLSSPEGRAEAIIRGLDPRMTEEFVKANSAKLVIPLQKQIEAEEHERDLKIKALDKSVNLFDREKYTYVEITDDGSIVIVERGHNHVLDHWQDKLRSTIKGVWDQINSCIEE